MICGCCPIEWFAICIHNLTLTTSISESFGRRWERPWLVRSVSRRRVRRSRNVCWEGEPKFLIKDEEISNLHNHTQSSFPVSTTTCASTNKFELFDLWLWHFQFWSFTPKTTAKAKAHTRWRKCARSMRLVVWEEITFPSLILNSIRMRQMHLRWCFEKGDGRQTRISLWKLCFDEDDEKASTAIIPVSFCASRR